MPEAAESPRLPRMMRLNEFQVLQHTLAGPAVCVGVGVHSGRRARLAIRPAAVDTGVVFVRSDLDGYDARIRVAPHAVVRTQLNTEIANASGVSVSTIEHLMAAFSALGVDNVVVEVDGPEAPIMDGSALPFIQLVDRAGRRTQAAPRAYIEVLETVEVRDGIKFAAVHPCDRFEIDVEIDFASAAIGRQRVAMAVTERSFRDELAAARTFGFLHEVESLRRAGLARGGSLDNAIVLDGDAILNPEGLRMADEFVRHKALDTVGDLYVLGAPLLGRFESRYGGHALNAMLVRALADRPSARRLRAPSVELALTA